MVNCLTICKILYQIIVAQSKNCTPIKLSNYNKVFQIHTMSFQSVLEVYYQLDEHPYFPYQLPVCQLVLAWQLATVQWVVHLQGLLFSVSTSASWCWSEVGKCPAKQGQIPQDPQTRTSVKKPTAHTIQQASLINSQQMFYASYIHIL